MEKARAKKLASRLSRATPVQLARFDLAQKRITNILRRHVVANHRTLEQKIADAGPTPQRINPHVIATALDIMERDGLVVAETHMNGNWMYLSGAPPEQVRTRLSVQLTLWRELQTQKLTRRVGQTLEIAVYKCLVRQNALRHLGAYVDLEEHDDHELFSKEEPPSMLDGRAFPGKSRVDFAVSHPTARWGAIEVKNKREWMYPSNADIRELLQKALAVDAIPILIARRIPFVTFRVLSPCGLVIHQTFNQLFPASELDLVTKIRDKESLGYHDVRCGNGPDARLVKFLCTNLPTVMPSAREKFDANRDLLERYADGEMSYAEFAARVRRRQSGTNEDSDAPEDDGSDANMDCSE